MQSFRGASWVPKILSDTAIILSLLGWKSFTSMLNEKIIQVTDETNKMKQEVDYWLTYFIAPLFFGYVFTAIFGIFWDVFIFDIVSWLFNKHCRQFFLYSFLQIYRTIRQSISLLRLRIGVRDWIV